MLRIMHVVGARPNFPKVAPIMSEMSKHPHQIQQLLVHTGQHYDYNMSQVFFEQLEMPSPDVFLNIGSGTHAVQTAAVMTAFEPEIVKHQPDWVVVVGDVNSTVACALVCAKLGVRVAHVEAGLRSRDRTMPEEINRLLTDQISDLLFTPSKDGTENLLREGIDPKNIHFVGNVMIDTLIKLLPKALERNTLADYKLHPNKYILVTLHRPSNVDDEQALRNLLRAMLEISQDLPVIFPVHPRTRKRIQELNANVPDTSLRMIDPLGYLDFVAMMNRAALVVTDSGGVQEETTYLGVPCVTVRPNTERPITITEGTNRLVGNCFHDLVQGIRRAMRLPPGKHRIPELWDGHAAMRITEIIRRT